MAPNRQFAINRQAYHDYEILERLESGLVLSGTEIKSIRAGKVDLRGSYARPKDNELWLYGMHVAPYEAGSMYNQDPKRPRKLLLHKDEISQIISQLSQSGLTMVPLRVYVKKHWAKVELGLARGKRKYDKRRAIIERDRDRETQRALRHSI